MHIEKNIVLRRAYKKPIVADLYFSKKNTNQPIVVFCHGYKGFKDWGAWELMAQYIAKNGFCFVKFNFSHNGGTIENPIDFPDLEAFGNNNYSKELDDLHDVLDWLQKYFETSTKVNVNNINTIGHSRGGGIVLLNAAEDRRIKKLITLASVSDFGKRSSTTGNLENWKKNGVKYVVNGRTKQKMPHYIQFYEDFKANEKRLHIQSAVEKLNLPLLIIHGNSDTSVDIEEAKKLYQWKPDSRLEIIDNADHVFNTKHPWERPKMSDELLRVSDAIIQFLKE